LDYYTGIVFEARDRDGGRAIFGGGRYDNLVGDVGGQPAGGIGFAMGDVVIRLTLEKYNCIGELPVAPAKVLVTLFSPETVIPSIAITAKIRNAGIPVEIYPEVGKLPRQFKYADRQKIRFILILGPDEVISGKVTLKDMLDGTQTTVPLTEAIELILK